MKMNRKIFSLAAALVMSLGIFQAVPLLLKMRKKRIPPPRLSLSRTKTTTLNSRARESR